MDTKQNEWTKRWKTWVRPTRLPGVWQRKEGGFLVRARVTSATTGHLVEVKKVLPQATEAMAFAWLEAERARVRTGAVSDAPPKTRFAEFREATLRAQAHDQGDPEREGTREVEQHPGTPHRRHAR